MKKAFRIIAFLEGLSYVLLLFLAVPIKYLLQDETYVKLLGMPHGLLFVVYLIISYLIREEMALTKREFAGVWIASIIPFGTFIIDKKYFKK